MGRTSPANLAAADGVPRPFALVAWTPHPMNVTYRIDDRTGAEDLFGPNFGDATVRTVSRAGYASVRPNVARLLGNIRFDMAGETALMDLVLTTKLEPPGAAATWLRRHRSVLGARLAGVTTVRVGRGWRRWRESFKTRRAHPRLALPDAMVLALAKTRDGCIARNAGEALAEPAGRPTRS